MTDALWYLSRGTGVVCLVLFSVAVALGIATRSGRALPGLPRFAVTAVHRNASMLALVLLVIHIGGLLFDPYAQLELVDVVIPFAGAYRPLWLGFGTLAFDLVIALIVTSLLRHRIGRRGFKVVHWSAYAMWPLAALHGLGNGTDSGSGWLRLILAACTALVLAAVVWRVTPAFAEYTRRRTRVPTVAPPGPPTTPRHTAVPVAGPRRATPVPAYRPPTTSTPIPYRPATAPATTRPLPAAVPRAHGSAQVPQRTGQRRDQWSDERNSPWNDQRPGQATSQWPSQPEGQWPGQREGWR
jgi:sulfoxide reductase heme-binding subunit YedZ